MKLFNRLKSNKTKEEALYFNIYSPVKGEVINITKTNDPLFSGEALGKGVGILVNDNTIVSPVSGTIKTFFSTKHAIGITTNEGIDVLIHVGIDTVELNGKFFKALKNQGDVVNQGDKLLEVEFDKIKEEGYDTTVLLVITNSQDYSKVKVCEGNKDISNVVIEVEK